MENIDIKYTLITGASGGIGYEFARIFAKEHHNLILVARNIDKLKHIKLELESKYKIIVRVFGIDLSKKDAANELYKKVKEEKWLFIIVYLQMYLI
ncbi:SDR family NAD(P)-dependent oxidoreductase [Clostridium nigeriense]|uniref:SDR family NAD(P)-dependent oxidoreductase n=1 Tax=Clostridium nigeriense TaxID=1805470 RepID=UPI003D332A03